LKAHTRHLEPIVAMESKAISRQDIVDISVMYGASYAGVKSVLLTEGSGAGFGPDGKLKIQFEPAPYSDELDKLGIEHTIELIGKNSRGLKAYRITFPDGTIITNGVEGHYAEWEAYRIARAKHKEAAQLATSWGFGQVMGFNHRLAGYNTVQEMIDSFFESERNQLIGMMEFIKSKKILDDLVRCDWNGFAYYYNGTGYKVQGYDVKLEENYQLALKDKI